MKSHQKPFFVLMVIVLLVGMVGLQPPKSVEAASPDVRISQVYGAGGNSGATYKNDFIELFNAGTTAVSLDGWSVQYASSGGATWGNKTDLSGTILPGHYYLIQEAAGNGGLKDLPAPDATGTINMSANSGKVALVNSTTPLTGYCTGSGIIDFVGYGTGTNCSEGSGPTPPTGSATYSVSRKEAGCQDTDDNNADFEAGPANPRNSESATHSCGTTEAIGSDLRISQVYGGGGNSGAPYTHDFIELFNSGSSPVSLAGMSVQYTSAAGTGNFGANNGQLTELPDVTINPGQYYLIQEAGGATGDPLPTPDHVDPTPISMSGNNGKVALVNSATTLGCNGDSTPCSPEQLALIVDLVGFGNANFYEGVAAVPTLSNSTAALRKGNGCIDTDENSLDFDVLAPAPRNSSTPAQTCGPAVDVPPNVIFTLPANNATNIAPDADITITFSEAVTVTDGWYTISCDVSSAHTAEVTNANPVFTLNPDSNFAANEVCTVTVVAANVSDQDAPLDAMEADYTFSFTIAEGCGSDFTPIYEIQGSTMRSPMEEQTVTTEGVVVGDFQTGGKDGFYIQDTTGDGNPATSDGIFIYYKSAPEVNFGDKVRVTGKVSEYYNQTQITGSAMQICSSGNEIEPTEISLPVESVDDFEKYEGMLVTFPQSLIIAEYFNYDRYGEIVLTSQRHMTPTAIVEPGLAAQAAAEAYLLDRITLDDGRTPANLHPAIHPNGLEFTMDNLFRGGGTLTNVTGVMDYFEGSTGNYYRIQPTQGAIYEDVNPRSEAPDIAEGDLTIASFNVLNYFVTLDVSGNRCGPFGNMECRGADNAAEFERQRAKIVAALEEINADVYGLMEIENDRPGGDDPVADLVAGLNEIQGAGTYAYIQTGAIGTDAIKQAILYKPDSVTPVDTYKVLDSSVDSRFIDTRNRPVLAQIFEDNLSGEQFIVAVNHLKSKGSACDGDSDTGDGQGNCNLTRLAAAQAMVDWLADPAVFGDVEKVLIIGDLNSYDKEDPINAIKRGADDLDGTNDDFLDMIHEKQGDEAYGYVYDGQTGYLDYALANLAMADIILDVNFWHINADEPDIIDYDNSFKPAEQAALLYAPDLYRSSDHDPVIVTLSFAKYPPVISSDDLGGPFYVGNLQEFQVRLQNPAPGHEYGSLAASIFVDGITLADFSKVEVMHPLSGTWVPLTPVVDGTTGLRIDLGPISSIPVISGFDQTLSFRVNFKTAGNYPVTGTLYDGAIDPTKVIATYSDTMVVAGLLAQDFGYMYQSGVLGVTAGFKPINFTLDKAVEIKVELFTGPDTGYVLLQTNTAISPAAMAPWTQFSGPFDIFGTFDYVADNVWSNDRETEYGQTAIPSRVLATITFPGGITLTAENTNLTGDRGYILNTLDEELASAPGYVYDPVYTPVGDIEFDMSSNTYTGTYTAPQVLAGAPMNDMARYLGALYRQAGSTITSIVFDGKTYSWNPAEPNTGSNWIDGDGKTLVSVVTAKFQAAILDGSWTTEPGYTMTVHDDYDHSATVTFKMIILNTLDDELESAPGYVYSPGYTYVGSWVFDDPTNIYTLTYNDTNFAPGAMNDLARYLGALHRQAGSTVASIEYDGTTYTWQVIGDELKGSNWRDSSGTTLMSVITADVLGGLIDPAVGFTLKLSDAFHSENVTFRFIINDTTAPTIVSGEAIGAAGFDDVAADASLTFVVNQGYTVDHIEFVMSEPVTVVDGTEVMLGGAPYGTITANGALLTVTPYPGNTVASLVGTFVFNVPEGKIFDLSGNPLGTLSATLIVVAVNNAPEADDQAVTTSENTPVAITLVATDVDGDTLTYAIVTEPAHGTVSLVGNVATYTPSLNYNGSDSFTFKVNDGSADSNVATVTILVKPSQMIYLPLIFK